MSQVENEEILTSASSRSLTEKEQSQEQFAPHRVFINRVDRFNSKHIASHLADLFYQYEKKVENESEMLGETDDIAEGMNPKLDKPPLKHYEVIGTLSSAFSKKTEDVSFVLEESSPNFYDEIDKCGVIIFDITQDPSEIPRAIETLKFLIQKYDELKEDGPKTYNASTKSQIFILISTIMTWGKTKSTFMETYGPFTEEHYRKRKANPKYKQHLECEKEIFTLGKKHRKKLKTIVICSGFTYGFEEETLSYLFKIAWSKQTHLPIFGNGNNRIPLIHVLDLAKVVENCITIPFAQRYIIAVEPVTTKLKDIVKAISSGLGKSHVREVQNFDDAKKFDDVNENVYELFTVNLNMKPAFLVENSTIEWSYPTGFANNISRIIGELKESRDLNPMKVVIHGPPGSGKTRLAQRICEKYGLHYVSIKTLIEETLQNLRDNITEAWIKIKAKEEMQRLKQMDEASEEEEEYEEEEEEEAEEEDDKANIEEWEEQIRDIQTVLSTSEDKRLPDEQITRMLKTFLDSNVCQNQGFVLDGFPKSIEQAEELFGRLDGSREGDEEEEQPLEADGSEEGGPVYNRKLMPHFVFSLEAPDDFLCKRIKKLREKDIENTHYSEEHMKRRLEAFRNLNTEDETVLNYFDEMEIHPKVFDVTEDTTEKMDVIFEMVQKILGIPVHYGISLEEIIQQKILEDEKNQQEMNQMEKFKMEENERALEKYRNKMVFWSETLEEIKAEEEKIIIAESEPLRNYLMEFIFPTLTKALTEVVKVKPDDPVDYVAEYLFKINPEGKFFDPSFSQKGADIMGMCKDSKDSLHIDVS